MSRLESILNNYNQFSLNQESAGDEFKEQMANAREMQQKAETAGDENSLDMMALHFFGDKLKNFISDKLGLNPDEIDKFTSNPTEYMRNAANDVLNNASNTIQDELNERGLNEEGILNRTQQLTEDGANAIRRRLLDDPIQEDEAEDVDDTTAAETPAETPTETPAEPPAEPLNIMDEPVEGDSAPVMDLTPTEEPATISPRAADSVPLELDEEEPPAAPTTAPPFGGVRMPGSEELQARFDSQINNPSPQINMNPGQSAEGEQLVNDISSHMRASGEGGLADRIDSGTTNANEVAEKLQSQATNDIFDSNQPGGTSERAQNLLQRAQNLPSQTSEATAEASEAATEAATEAADETISDELLAVAE